MTVTLFRHQRFALGVEVSQTIFLEYKLLRFLGRVREGNPKKEILDFLICRPIISFN